MSNPLILYFIDDEAPAKRLGKALQWQCAEISCHQFPDKENLITLPTTLPNHVVLYRSLHNPNEKLIQLMLASQTARRLGANRISLVAPYLCYMRQDAENHPGEAISQQIIGKFLAEFFDDVITVDAHLHRVHDLHQAIPVTNAINLMATEPMVEFLKSQAKSVVLFGPDSESEQWVNTVAEALDFEFAVANKIRHGDRDIEIQLPEFDFEGKTIVILDDMASTGRTISLATELLKAQGAKQIDTLVTHALFFGDAKQNLTKSGVKNIWSTDSVEDPTNVIYLDQLFAKALRKII